MTASAPRRKLDRRLVALPLIALATAATVLVPAEIVLRRRYPDQPVDRCLDQAVVPLHGKAGCTSYVKAAEGPWVQNRYNECGYRSLSSCGPLPPGALRVAVIGSSMGAGTFVPGPQSVASRLAANLSVACGRAVQDQNLAVPAFPIDKLAVSGREAFALHPDALLITVTSFDFNNLPGTRPPAAKPFIKKVTEAAQTALKDFAVYRTAKRLFLSSERDYLDFISAQRRSDADILRESRDGLRLLSEQIGLILKSPRRSATAIALVFMPNREELARTHLQAGRVEPVSRALRRIAEAHGISYIDGLSAFPSAVPTASLYYVANGHLNATGDDYIARELTRKMTGSMPPFATCRGGSRG